MTSPPHVRAARFARSRAFPLRRRLALRGATDRPVFIGGCPRSGTTLLGAMVHAHPDLAIPPETRFVVEGWQRRNDFGDLTDASARRKFGEWVVGDKSTRFASMHIDPDQVVEAVMAAPPTVGSLTATVLEQFATAHGASRWGDKRPKYVELLPVVFGLYPDAQFIHLIRDARGCTASLKKLGWWGWTAAEALDRWRASVAAGIAARDLCAPDQYLEVRYEDLVADPRREVERIGTFLGVDQSARMLEHGEAASLIDKSYHPRVAAPVDSSAVESWRQALEPEELALVEDKVGDLLDEFRYPRLTGLPALPAELSERYDTAMQEREEGRHRLRTTRSERLAEWPTDAATLTVGQQRLRHIVPLGR